MSDASDATSHPRVLELPRDDSGLATSTRAVRRVKQLLTAFVDEYVTEAGADGVVVALNGDVDSTVAAAMAVDALGQDRVTALVMPAKLNDEASARDAEAIAAMLGIEYHRLQLHPLVTVFQSVLGDVGEPIDDLAAVENAGERFRTTCAYYVANTSNSLVVGSVNRTDRLLGSVTKYGENGVDVSLLGDLFRTEVRALARDLGVPDEVFERSTRRPGPTGTNDPERLGIEPQTLDSVLRFAIDEDRSDAAVSERLDVDPAVVRRAREWCATSRHKRHQPPKPSMNA